MSVPVHSNILKQDNGQPDLAKPKRHNAKLCPSAIRQRIINALANGDSIRTIARALHVSNNTVVAIREQDWQQVASRKSRIAAQSERNATRAAELIAHKLERDGDNIPLNLLIPTFQCQRGQACLLRSDAPALPPQLVDHHHVHEFVARNIRQVDANMVLDALPRKETPVALMVSLELSKAGTCTGSRSGCQGWGRRRVRPAVNGCGSMDAGRCKARSQV